MRQIFGEKGNNLSDTFYGQMHFARTAGERLFVKRLQLDHVAEARRQFTQLIKISACDNPAIKKFIYTITFYYCR